MYDLELTPREKDVLEVLWESESPLHASEITSINPELKSSTVQVSLKNLIKKKYVKVSDIDYSGTVLSRRYEPIVAKENYKKKILSENLGYLKNEYSIKNIVATLLDMDDNQADTIKELEQFIAEKKHLK